MLGFPYIPPRKREIVVRAIKPGVMYLEVPGEKYYAILPLHKFKKEIEENPPILFTEFGRACLSERLALRLLELDPELQFDPTYLPDL